MSTKKHNYGAAAIGDNHSFKQALAAKIGELNARETLSLELQALMFLSMNRREAYAWLKEKNCYVRYIEKKKMIEVKKM
jgi:hypothetical protein